MESLSKIQVVQLGAHPPDKAGEIADRCFSAFSFLDNIHMSLGRGDSPREAADNAVVLVAKFSVSNRFNLVTDLRNLSLVSHLDSNEYCYYSFAVLTKPARS